MADAATLMYEVFIWRNAFDHKDGVHIETYMEEADANARVDELVSIEDGDVLKAWVIKREGEITKIAERSGLSYAGA